MNAAESMMTNGKIYSAHELSDMGLVNVLAENGKGQEAVNQFIRKHRRARNSFQAIQAVRQFYKPISYEELLGITKIWVDAAMKLKSKDLRKMERIVKAQDCRDYLRGSQNDTLRILRTKQDRRFDYKDITFPFIDNSGRKITGDRRKFFDRRLFKYSPHSNQTLPSRTPCLVEAI